MADQQAIRTIFMETTAEKSKDAFSITFWHAKVKQQKEYNPIGEIVVQRAGLEGFIM